MITLKLEEKNAKELLTFLLNQKAWLEGAIRREKEDIKKTRYENTLKIISPVIDELQYSLLESFEPQKSDTTIAYKKSVKIVCKKCGWNAELHGFSINEKERILKFWDCPNLCGKEHYLILPGD